MKKNIYRDIVGIKFSNQENFEKGVDIIFETDSNFELIEDNIFLFSEETTKELEEIFKEKGLETKRIPVIPMDALPPEKQTEIREKNLKYFHPLPF